jgi:hypothetical protein
MDVEGGRKDSGANERVGANHAAPAIGTLATERSRANILSMGSGPGTMTTLAGWSCSVEHRSVANGKGQPSAPSNTGSPTATLAVYFVGLAFGYRVWR